MTSFQIAISPSKRAAGRFISKVRRALQRALVEEQAISGINQSAVAEAIGVHRSVVSRELNGRQDITLGRIAELAWAMGREIDFQLVKPGSESGINAPLAKPGALSTGFEGFEAQMLKPTSINAPVSKFEMATA
ncbi:helix-turn-helix transcriptional regulator [Sphingopyxis sp. L1A2A]|uniref:helix-turn-helix domain-containing protein n=1 Tax=Sphingopyxis sp. L1A2A TaxID=2502247 RepID=UPI00148503FD|nr:helix-turn-helix transcriptional regulator [Sphingopyxis sp. L1A2A]